MKHTKNILKSLLITVMALSLLAVSCKKDEGGSKPTDPTPTTISEQNIVDTLQGFKTVKVVTDAEVDFSAVTIGNGGTVALTVTKKNATLSLATFKADMKTKLGEIAVKGATVTVGDAGGTAAASGQLPVTFDVTIKANDGYELDSTIAGYNKAGKTVKLTLKFTPSSGNNWAD